VFFLIHLDKLWQHLIRSLFPSILRTCDTWRQCKCGNFCFLNVSLKFVLVKFPTSSEHSIPRTWHPVHGCVYLHVSAHIHMHICSEFLQNKCTTSFYFLQKIDRVLRRKWEKQKWNVNNHVGSIHLNL
jgi:hypothetical protein